MMIFEEKMLLVLFFKHLFIYFILTNKKLKDHLYFELNYK